jgi:urease alpha subunit
MRLILCALTCLWFLESAASAATLLIQGATLIDGTGKAAIPDARILIDGDVIRSVWRGADAAPSIPAGTQILDARGKFVIPGLIDSHVHYRPYMGEMFLAHGVMTVYDLGNPVAWQTAVKKGTELRTDPRTSLLFLFRHYDRQRTGWRRFARRA